MKDRLYNPLKLSAYRPLFGGKRVLICGAGAVGSNVAEALVKMGCSLDLLDFDKFTLENAAKHSCLVRTPEDVGQNKARCVARRVQPFLEEGCTANGVDTDLCRIGPEVLADYDVVVLCLDNYAAKALFNELWMQLPPERRPVVIMDGTQDEMARSVMLDGREFCLRCLMDERWLENGAVRTSCSGPQLRTVDGETVSVRTSGLASSHAANLTAEQFRAQVIGVKGAMNRRLTYYAYPTMELTVTHPKAKRGCPGCAVQPPKEILWLEGTVLETTLGQALEQIAARLDHAPFELQVHWLNYKEHTYTGFIRSDLCHVCGAPISVMQHEGRTFLQDLRCQACRDAGRPARYDVDFAMDDVLYAFSPQSDPELKKRTLFQLGYPLGAHLKVCCTQADGSRETIVFALRGDPEQMHRVQYLE